MIRGFLFLYCFSLSTVSFFVVFFATYLDNINGYLLNYFGRNIVFVVNMGMEMVVYVILCENFWVLVGWWI